MNHAISRQVLSFCLDISSSLILIFILALSIPILKTAYMPLLIVLLGIILLFLLIAVFKLNAFLSFIIVCLLVGILQGMELNSVIQSIQTGIGNTLGLGLSIFNGQWFWPVSLSASRCFILLAL